MDSISTNTLFHFTNSLENLISILENHFVPHYCIESWEDISHPPISYGIPMVSFCDIPLSQIESHIHKYGKYAIGLKKSWGKKNGISPVQYTYSNSETAKCIENILISIVNKELVPQLENKSDLLNKTQTFWTILKYCCFLKPCKGIIWRHGRKGRKRHNYYDEREWRYVPNITLSADDIDISTVLIPENKFDQIQISNEAIKGYALKFKPTDISYIIINRENERNTIHNRILEIKRTYPYQEAVALTTKIISVFQIKNDF